MRKATAVRWSGQLMLRVTVSANFTLQEMANAISLELDSEDIPGASKTTLMNAFKAFYERKGSDGVMWADDDSDYDYQAASVITDRLKEVGIF